MRFLLVAFLLLAGAFTAPAGAQEERFRLGEDDEVVIDADTISFDQANRSVTARGKVRIQRGETELEAEEVRLWQEGNEAEATGGVRLSDPEGLLFADSVRFHLDDETGTLIGASLKSKRMRYSLWGSRIEKGIGQTYSIRNGRFTTCDCEEGPPSWSIRGKQFDITPDGYGRIRGGAFCILDVPVLYLPRAIVPANKERQSGFLMPQLGFSNRRGFQTLLPFYWAIDRSQDLTLGFDVETAARIGLIADYRYALTRESGGVLSGAYFSEFLRGSASVGAVIPPENRWSVMADQQHAIPGLGAVAFLDGRIVSDDIYFREINAFSFEYGRSVFLRSLPFTEMRAGLYRSDSRHATLLEGSYFQNLSDPRESRTLQTAPRLTWWGQRPVGRWLTTDARAELVNYQRGQGPSGGRLDLETGLEAALPLRRWGFGSLRVSGRETAYALSDRTVPGSAYQLDGFSNRGLFQVRSELGSAVSRVYPFPHLGLERVKHTIEPLLSYWYVPGVGQDDLPFWDGVDRLNSRSLLTYGITSRLLGKAAVSSSASETPSEADGAGESTRELARFSVFQSFDFRREIPNLTLRGSADRLSDIAFAARMYPNRYVSVRMQGNVDPSSGELSLARVGFLLTDPRASSARAEARGNFPNSLGVSYQFLANDLQEQIAGNLSLQLTQRIGLMYAARFNLAASTLLDNFVALRFLSACDCWALDLAVSNRANPPENEARIQVTLLGLSTLKTTMNRAAQWMWMP